MELTKTTRTVMANRIGDFTLVGVLILARAWGKLGLTGSDEL